MKDSPLSSISVQSHLSGRNCTVILHSPQAPYSRIIIKPFYCYTEPSRDQYPIWMTSFPATQSLVMQTSSRSFWKALVSTLATTHHLSSREWHQKLLTFLILTFQQPLSRTSSDFELLGGMRWCTVHRLLLLISPDVFLCLLSSHTVQILEESAARPWGLELQPRGQMYPVLLLQEHCPLHHWGCHSQTRSQCTNACVQESRQDLIPHHTQTWVYITFISWTLTLTITRTLNLA